jgi:hypothetical protein
VGGEKKKKRRRKNKVSGALHVLCLAGGVSAFLTKGEIARRNMHFILGISSFSSFSFY